MQKYNKFKRSLYVKRERLYLSTISAQLVDNKWLYMWIL